MLPSKKAIRKLKTLPFCGRAMQYLTLSKQKPFVSFSIKIIERKKYLVAIGNTSEEKENNFITVMNKEGKTITLLPNDKWSVTINHFIFKKITVYNDECISRFFKDCNANNYKCFIEHYYSYKSNQRKIHLKEKQLLLNKIWGNNFSKTPRNFRYWCDKEYGYKVIFDTNDRNTGFCTYCKNKIVFSEKLIVGHKYKCPTCKKVLSGDTFKKNKRSKHKCFSMIDLLKEQLVVRHFDLSEKITALNSDDNSIIGIDVRRDLFEYERDLFNKNFDSFNYYTNKYDITTSMWYWINSKPSMGNHLFFTLPNRYYEPEKVYTKNFSNIKECVSDTTNNVLDTILYSNLSNNYRVEDLLLYNNETVFSEKLEKVGLLNLSKEVLSSRVCYWNHNKFPKITENMSVKEFLGINKRFMRYAIENDVKYDHIRCMQRYNDVFKDKFEDYLLAVEYCKNGNFNTINTINMIVDFCENYSTTIKQVISYLSYQNGNIIELRDYVSMYLEAYRLSNPNKFTVIKYSKDFLFPQSLIKAHDNADKWLKEEKNKEMKKKIHEKNKQLKKVIKVFGEIDGITLGNYRITLPHCNSDFVRRGTNMRICVGNGKYFDDMCKGVAIICFVSKDDSKEKNFGTIEFSLRENQINMVQARGFANKDISNAIQCELKQLKLLLEKCISNNAKVKQL